MYCIKCGKELPEGANVCPNCGNVIKTIGGEKETPHSTGFYISMLLSGLVIIMIFLKWVNTSITSYFGSKGFSLFQMSKFASTLKDMTEGEGSFLLGLIAILIIVMCAVCIICTAIYIWKSFSRDVEPEIWGKRGMMFAIIISVTIIILSFIINKRIERETEGLISGLIQLTAAPYCTLIAAVINRLCMSKVM